MDSQPFWDGADLADLLRLERLAPDHYRSICSERNLGGEVFGGQYLGQGLAAALASGEGRAPHALFGFFLKPARADRPLDFRVERVREGRSFAHRRVQMMQGQDLVFCMEVSLHDAETDAPQHRAAMPSVPPPEGLPSLFELADRLQLAPGSRSRALMTTKRGVELRPVDSHAGFGHRSGTSTAACWIRSRHFSESDVTGSCAALAYLSDYWANFACRMLHTDFVFDGQLSGLSLNHGLWFHHRPVVSDWLLFAMDSPAATGGTGLNRGLVYNREGMLLASMTQEALIRGRHPAVF